MLIIELHNSEVFVACRFRGYKLVPSLIEWCACMLCSCIACAMESVIEPLSATHPLSSHIPSPTLHTPSLPSHTFSLHTPSLPSHTFSLSPSPISHTLPPPPSYLQHCPLSVKPCLFWRWRDTLSPGMSALLAISLRNLVSKRDVLQGALLEAERVYTYKVKMISAK